MKNIHLLQTDNKWSRLYFNVNDKEFQICEIEKTSTILKPNRHIYITSDEEIKEGDWCLNIPKNIIYKKDGLPMDIMWKKIILTTDQELINNGVQSIDNEFLEWFVKNLSCEEVTVEVIDDNIQWYKIIILKENLTKCYCGHTTTCDCGPETLEEAAVINYKKLYEGEPLTQDVPIDAFIDGAKWQQEQIGKSEFLQKLRATLSDAEARRIIKTI